MKVDKKFILSYFNQFVFNFIYRDLENCINARANFLVAQALMSYTEYIGALINGHLGISSHSEEDFNKLLEYFDWNGDGTYYQNFEIRYKETSTSTRINNLNIYKAFRCGLIHEYLPKLPATIHNNPEKLHVGKIFDYCIDKDQGIGWIPEGGNLVLRFHTNAYFRDFKKAIDKVVKKISDNDPEIISNITTSLERIYSRELIP